MSKNVSISGLELSSLFPKESPVDPATPSIYSLEFGQNVLFDIVLGVALTTLSLFTFLGNAMVINAIRTERKLRTVSVFFVI